MVYRQVRNQKSVTGERQFRWSGGVPPALEKILFQK